MNPGNINFIGATSLNNGLTALIANSSNLHPAGTITVTYNGSVGEAFYQTAPFWASDDVNVLYPKFPINEFVALFFLAPIIKKGKSYGYSYKWTKEKMEADEIFLPVDKKRQIDFAFIEERVRELEEERVRELEAYLQEAGFENCILSKEEKKALQEIERGTKKMQRFEVVKKFNVSNSHNILKSDVIFGSGTTPYVTASEGNNSIVSYISYDTEMIEKGNSIMIGGKTLVITYQPCDFFSNDSHNLVLTIKDVAGRNESAQLFMVAALYKTLGPKYSWGDSISKAKINSDVVYLPVTSDGNNVDYDFMATCITAIKKQCIAKLKQEINRERAAYKQVLFEQDENIVDVSSLATHNGFSGIETLIAAEPFECYKWEGFDQSIRDFFGNNQTILVGCYKDKQYLDWIQSHNIYNIRLGKTKGSMEANRELFDSTSLLLLYELGKPNKLSAYKITGHQEMNKEELIKLDYPNKKPRKNYMAFSITPLDMDLTFLVEHHLIERIIELDADHTKGTPIFIEP